MTARSDFAVIAREPDRWRRPALGAYALALGGWIATIGVPTDPFQMFIWLWLATIAWHPSAPPRHHLAFARDWSPVFAGLIIYLYSRGLVDELVPVAVHWTEPITIDRWIGGGELPTERLQDALCASPCTSGTPPRWYDAVLTTVYFTHFVTGLALAVVLWLRNRAKWVPWMRRYLVINFAALAVYIFYPMAPPWLASRRGYIDDHLPRLTGRGWDDLGLGGFHVVLAKVGNPVAAMPSLHGGIAMLVALYAVTRLRAWWRWFVLAYPLLMGFALVYYAEHYVIDLVAGFALAGVVMVGCSRWERRHPSGAADPAPLGR